MNNRKYAGGMLASFQKSVQYSREENIIEATIKSIRRRTLRMFSDEEILTKAHIDQVHKELQFSLVVITTDTKGG